MSGEPWGGVTDAELAEQLAAGSSQALEQLYDRYAALAYSVAMRVLSDPGKYVDHHYWERARAGHAANR